MDVKQFSIIAKVLAPPIRALAARLDRLEAAAGLGPEAKNLADAYRGAWKWNDSHSKGTLITDHGSLWLCLKDSGKRPGESSDWRLVSKGGRPPEHSK